MRYTLNYYLDSKEHADGRAVILFLYSGGKKFKLNTGKRVPKKDWDTAKQIAKKSFRHYREYNKFFDSYKSFVDLKFTDIQTKSPDIDFESAKQLLTEQLLTRSDGKPIDKLFDEYLDYKRATSNGYKQRIRVVKGHVVAYFKSAKIKPYLCNIDRNFMNNMTNYLFSIDVANVTTSKYMSIFKSFIAWCGESGYEINHNTQLFKRPRALVKSEKVALSRDEFIQLCNLTGLLPYLERTRDLFIFQTCTGQRVSDLILFDKSQIVEKKQSLFWEFRQKKTKTFISIPLPDLAVKILEKYDFVIPVISDQKYNKYIKILGKELGLTDMMTVFRQVGSKVEETRSPKWETLSSHTARRTHTTLSAGAGMTALQISKITGHVREEEVMLYDKGEANLLRISLNKVFDIEN